MKWTGMAAAASSSALASSVEKTNGAKLSRLLIDGGTTVLRNVFDNYHPPANLATGLNASYSILNNLFSRRILNGHQWDKLFPPGGAAQDSNTFDITLLFLLLTNICGLSPPLSGWHSKPPPSETSREANLARIKFFRNQLYGYVAATGVDTPTFNALWQEISAVLVSLGLGHAEIDRLKAERCGEEDYLDDLRDWAESEEHIKTQLKDIRHVQTSTQQTVEGNKCKLEEIHQIEKKTHEVVTNVHRAQQEDRSNIQKYFSKIDQDVQELHHVHFTDHRTLQYTKTKVEEVSEANVKMSQTVEGNKCKLEEVHQVVTEIRHTQFNQDQEDENVLKKLAKVDAQIDIRYYSERYLEGTREPIFVKVNSWLDDRSSPNRVMVISGNAGMGKSVFAAEMCKRMQETGRLSGSHFCQHNKARRRDPKVMLHSLAQHMSCCLPEYKKALVEQLSTNLGKSIKELEVGDLFELLFEEPLSGLSDPRVTYLMVIDALDESEYQGRNYLLDMIAKYFNKLPLWIRFLVTTRPEINISDSLKDLYPLVLKPNDEENVKDIRLCFELWIGDVLQAENREVILQKLVQKSGGVILYAQFLVDFIKKNFSIVTLKRLDSILPTGISSVYQSYFKRLETDLCNELKITVGQYFDFLSAITAAREPLPLGFVSKLFFPDQTPSDVERKVGEAIACISSLLPVEDDCIHFFHKSVKDWLADTSCYGQHKFSVDANKGHRILSRLCSQELNDVKRKGIDTLQPFCVTAKYALQHGVQHMLQLDDGTRACSLEEVVNNYVLDVELVYAKLCVNSSAASEDIVCVQQQEVLKDEVSVSRQKILETLLFLLRKHKTTLKEFPITIFQTVLNEGGDELSSQALKLLEAKFSNLPYMEYLHKNEIQGVVQTRFDCSSQVACFDVSPQSEFMVCECRDGTIQLWSILTGKQIWKRSVIKPKHYKNHDFGPFRMSVVSPLPYGSLRQPQFVASYFRSVVFHPTEDVILPGVLSHAYTFDGDLNPLFPESKCSFSVCSISGDKILTDCPDDAKCLIMWSLKDGTETARVTRDEDVLSFAWSHDRRLLAISHVSGSVCLVDAMIGFRTLTETTPSDIFGMIAFSPDCRFLFCQSQLMGGVKSTHTSYQGCQASYRVSVDMQNHGHFSLHRFSCSASSKLCKPESHSLGGFLLGDPLFSPVPGYECGRLSFYSSVYFVLNKQSVLKSYVYDGVVEMWYRGEVMKTEIRLLTREFKRAYVDALTFSANGDTVYVLSKGCTGGTRLTAWEVSSRKLKAEKSFAIGLGSSLLAVREGILLKSSGTLELWNFELTRPIHRWADVSGILHSISDKLVACFGPSGHEVSILDTVTGDRLLTFKLLSVWVIACNSKCQLMTFDHSQHSLALWQSQTVRLWEERQWHSCGSREVFRFPPLSGLFSPKDDFILVSVRNSPHTGLYVLDAVSGKMLHKLCEPPRCLKFCSNEECVIYPRTDRSRGCRLELFNVRSGDLLSALDIDVGFNFQPLATFPGKLKGLIAVASESFKLGFKIVKVKLPGENKYGRRRERFGRSYTKQ